MKCDLCDKETYMFLSYKVVGTEIKYCCKECWDKMRNKVDKSK